MAKKSIVGVERVDYKSKNGTQVTGVRVFIATELMFPSVGVSVKEEYISGGDVKDYPLGEVQAILYEPTFRNNYRCVGVLYANNK